VTPLASVPRADFAVMEEAQPKLLDAALRGPLVLQRHGRDAFVILPVDQYRALLEAAQRNLPPGPPVIEG